MEQKKTTTQQVSDEQLSEALKEAAEEMLEQAKLGASTKVTKGGLTMSGILRKKK